MTGMPDLEPLFDLHLHPHALTAADLESMRLFGVAEALAFADPLADATPKRLLQQLERLVSREAERLKRSGIAPFLAVGVHPQSLPARGLTEVLAHLPELFRGPVVALGEIGLSRGGEDEEHAFLEQLDLARRLQVPVVVHTPSHDKERLTRRTLALLRASRLPPSRVLVDHATLKTARLAIECGHFAGLSVHPESLTAERAVVAVRRLGATRLCLDSDAGAGASDILGLARTAHLLQKAKLSARVLARVGRENARSFLKLG
jgi:predicted metal-dependent TIM-barrel fold hydrolase